MMAAVGTITGYTSSTPTSSCTFNTGAASSSPISCSSVLTVPSSGLAVGVAFQRTTGSFGFTNMTAGNTVSPADGSELQNGSNATAGSLTPASNVQITSESAAIAANTWH